ncbi:DUF6600 domain-containing protein [Arundinibacter roseus]|uniref:Prolin-rich transmembrane protein n=1 Tax=Arundinibacter roseus TaxID=2070510 RepID=A0A4R4KGA0_9BACT|nr:DUF6600 domain-containing protein [Arundinibacter roseus]TDB65932.1 hypothetical protein EZE20_09200 [Arundinibacter roseus]
MKTIKSVYFLLALLTAGFFSSSGVQAQPQVGVSFQVFYNELAPYGRWMSHPQYGSVWSPNVGNDFQPYGTNGQWVVTEYGNTWVSDYDWGWAPFHYGRWFFDDMYGWAWVPDYEWGPAWVDWRSGGGYYGWAPLWPGIRVGVSFNIPFRHWIFVPQRYIARRGIFRYCVPRTRIVNVYNQTTIINNYYRNDNRMYAYGPRHSEIERVTRGSVPVYRAEEVRSSRYTASRQNADGTYRANGNSPSGLYREDRNTNTNRGAASNRTYDANTSSGGRSSYEADDSGRSSNRVESGRTYEAPQPAARSRSNSSGTYTPNGSREEYNAPQPRTYEAPQPSSRSRSSSSNSSSREGYNAPQSRSSSPSVERPSSRSRESSPRVQQAPSRSQSSERARTSAPQTRSSSRSSERPAAAPSRSSGSTERSSSSRERSPR